MNELNFMEKKVILNLYTGDMTKKEFAGRFGLEVNEIAFIKEDIKEKIADFIQRQMPMDTLLYEIFRGMCIMGREPKKRSPL